MIRGYLQEGHSLPKTTQAAEYQGAISFGIPGIYSNLYKIDIKAMYPSILMQYKYYNKEKDPKGNFLKLVEYFASSREKYKQLYKETNDIYYDGLQNAMKIAANSLYGFLGTPGLMFNDPPGAAFVTETGREILSYTIEWATSKNTKYWTDLFEEKTK
jgi:DNA polymerase elongation subunit (family B)